MRPCVWILEECLVRPRLSKIWFPHSLLKAYISYTAWYSSSCIRMLIFNLSLRFNFCQPLHTVVNADLLLFNILKIWSIVIVGKSRILNSFTDIQKFYIQCSVQDTVCIALCNVQWSVICAMWTVLCVMCCVHYEFYNVQLQLHAILTDVTLKTCFLETNRLHSDHECLSFQHWGHLTHKYVILFEIEWVGGWGWDGLRGGGSGVSSWDLQVRPILRKQKLLSLRHFILTPLRIRQKR